MKSVERLHEEIITILNAYGREGKIGTYEILGVLEAVKNDVVESNIIGQIEDHMRKEDEGNNNPK